MHRIEPGPTRVMQTVTALQEALSGNTWSSCLPGERILSAHLGVSRPTLRAALEILERQKWIRTHPGSRRVILRHGGSGPAAADGKVIILAKESERDLTRASLLYIDTLRSHLEGAGLKVEFHSNPLFGRKTTRPREGLLPGPAAASAFVLFSLPGAIQRYCRERAYPAVVAGSVAESGGLPSLDIDYRAVARHAVGTLAGRGHRRIILFASDGRLVGDVLTETGFRETAESFAERGLVAEVIRHAENSEDIFARLKSLMRRSVNRPTAIVTVRAHHAVTILSGLGALGLRVPSDVSLICRDAEPTLNWTVPHIARYRFTPEHFAARLAGMVREVALGRVLARDPYRIAPEFDAGESLGPVRT